MTVAEELKLELQREEEEFHVINPRKYFLGYIVDTIRKREDRKAPLFDFRGKCIAAQFLLKNDSDILTEWDNHYYSTSGIPSKDVEVYGTIVYENGRIYLRSSNMAQTCSGKLDITEYKVSQSIIVSDEMYENRLNILKEEGFVIENHVFEFKNPIACEYTSPFLKIPGFYVKLPD
jgi:hypothetical protein